MEGSDKTTAEVQRWQSTGADYYAGTKEQLIAAGICKACWFPAKLILEICRDGTPKIGNGGKQRTQRTYVVEGREPETILTHRRCADGSEKWTVQVAVGDVERKRRKEVEREAHDARIAEANERDRERKKEKLRALRAALPTVYSLRERYPELSSVQGEVITNEDGTRRQCLQFYARSLDVLVRYGLVTDEMLAAEDKGGYRCEDLRDGRSFFLNQPENPGTYWYVGIWTSETTRERKHFPLTEARRVLKQIAGVRAIAWKLQAGGR